MAYATTLLMAGVGTAFTILANAKTCPDVIDLDWCNDKYTCTVTKKTYILDGASYFNPILAFDTVQVHLTGSRQFFYGYRQDDSFWNWNFWLQDQIFGGAETATPEPISAAYRSLVPNNTATEWLSPYGDSELAVNANDDLAFECIYDRQQKSSNILPAFIEREGLMPFDISWTCFCWILFLLAVGVFIIAETLASHVVVRFAVIAPSMILLMLFIVMAFMWNRARQMMMLVPGVALGGWAVAQDETLTEQINNILGIVLGVLVAVMCYASYGIANDRCKCCGNQRDRLDTIKYLVSGGLYFGCILVSVVLSKSMFWRAMFTMLLFTLKFIFHVACRS